MTFSKGDTVQWDWGDLTAKGSVDEVFTSTVTKTIKGTEITRYGGDDGPAYLIQQNDRDAVLKLHSEVEAA